MENKKKFLDAMESDIMNADIPDSDQNCCIISSSLLQRRRDCPLSKTLIVVRKCGKTMTI